MKRKIFRLILTVWFVLWAFFLLREDKDGQYKTLTYLYSHSYGDKIRYIMGVDLYDFLIFCKQHIPRDSTYELLGFKKYAIGEVRARYFLWPSRRVESDGDFKIIYAKKVVTVSGYKEHKRYNGKGHLLAREGESE